LAQAGEGAADSTEGMTISSEDVEQTTQETVVVDGSNDAPAKEIASKREPGLMQYLPLIVIFVVMYMLLFRGPRKKQQKHQQMVKSLRKNDRVRTIGGILGTVIDVKDDEITVKIDESNNTKIKITASAVSTVLSDEKI